MLQQLVYLHTHACTAYFAAITVLYKYQLSLIDPRGKIVL